MASEVSISNSALQHLGSGRIVSLDEDSKLARECKKAYEPARDSELRAHPWNFAVARVRLAANSTPPEFGPANSFTLPTDFIRLLHRDNGRNRNDHDWQIEGRKILTNDSAPLDVRYVRQVVDVNTMDPLFREALALRMAIKMCEAITQSNTKKDALKDDYIGIITQAKLVNAIENTASEPPEDTWISERA